MRRLGDRIDLSIAIIYIAVNRNLAGGLVKGKIANKVTVVAVTPLRNVTEIFLDGFPFKIVKDVTIIISQSPVEVIGAIELAGNADFSIFFDFTI